MAEAKDTARIEAFSDGVFAIAITLLVLDLKVPAPAAVEKAGLLRALVDPEHLSSYLAFFMSFAVILVMWVNHHRIFTVVKGTDDAFMYWNGLLLMFVTVVPFPTSLLAAHLTLPDAPIAAAAYAGMGFVIALAFTGLWRHATRNRRLLVSGREDEVDELTKQYRYGPVAYLVAFGLSFVSAWASVGICLALAVFFAFRGFFNVR